MWIENDKGIIYNGDTIKHFYIMEDLNRTSLLELNNRWILCGYLGIHTICLYERLSREKAEKIYSNLKAGLKVGFNFISKEQLLEGTD